eukprot:3684499-Rhodomonas_salina.1
MLLLQLFSTALYRAQKKKRKEKEKPPEERKKYIFSSRHATRRPSRLTSTGVCVSLTRQDAAHRTFAWSYRGWPAGPGEEAGPRKPLAAHPPPPPPPPASTRTPPSE